MTQLDVTLRTGLDWRGMFRHAAVLLETLLKLPQSLVADTALFQLVSLERSAENQIAKHVADAITERNVAEAELPAPRIAFTRLSTLKMDRDLR